MFIRSSRTNQPKGDGVSPALTMIRSLERRERSRVGSLQAARIVLAGKLRLGIGTLENLVRGRVKRIDEQIRDRIQALMIRELEAEIARLTHELHLARQGGSHLASDEVGAIETLLAQAKTILSGGER